MEIWVYYNTYSGTPQGSLISPILANIYLNELDLCGVLSPQHKTKNQPSLQKSLDVRCGKQKWLECNEAKISEGQRQEIMAQIRELNRYLRSVPYSDPMDMEYRRIVYVRYADDFLIGVIGNKEDTSPVKSDVGTFIKECLHLEMSPEKTLIPHSNDFAHFLGYLIIISREQNSTRTKAGFIRRTNVGKIKLYVPKEK